MDYTRKRLIRKLNGFLILALVAGAALFFTSLSLQEEYVPLPGTSVPGVEAPAEEQKGIGYYATIEESGLFGRRREPEPPTEPVVEPPGEPELPSLKLMGTVIFSSGGGMAVIKDPQTGEEETVRTGGKISGMELVSVEWDSAFLAGEPGELTIEIEDSGAEAAPSAAGPAQAPGRRAAPGGAETSFTVPRSRVDEAIADAESILRDVRVVPADRGFRVTGIRQGSLPDEFGLKDGDVITRVNRTALDGPDNIMRAYNEVLQRGFAAVEVMRDGQRINLRYRIER